MPSALEKLVKVLKLEQDTGYQDKAVIGGLRSFAGHWASDAHAQARRPDHHALVDELSALIVTYVELTSTAERHQLVKHMLGRITGRIPPPAQAGATTPQPPDERTDAPTQPKAAQETPQAGQPPPEERARQGEDKAPPAEGEPPAAERTADALSALEFTPVQTGGTGTPEALAFAAPRPRAAPKLTRPPRRKRGPRNPEREAEFWQGVQAPITTVRGVGPKVGEKLANLGLQTIHDWLFFFPRRYDDYTQMLPLNRLKPGMEVTVIGTIRESVVARGQRGVDVLHVTLDDGTGLLKASFFGQPYLRNKLSPGLRVVFSGKTTLFQNRIRMDNPEWEYVEQDALHTRGIVPVYPLTKGLSAHAMRRLTRDVIDRWSREIPDFMPETVLERANLADLGWAVQHIHFPESHEALAHARRRLTFDELILLQLAVLRNRREWQAQPGLPLTVEDGWLVAFIEALPYALTGAQQRAIQIIREDMARDVPMNRLLQGDVGSGKTVVSVVAMAIAVANGCQAAIMAPTGILAEQHFQNITDLFRRVEGGDSVNIKLLTSATPAQERADILWGLGEGSVHIVVGTHALIQEDVHFARLGLVVIDEQHRFGVEQRGRLRGKGFNPHVLVMTATPIPRTLALTMCADLDLTVLDEMPPGRAPVRTRVLLPTEREQAYNFIRAQIRKGQQAFIIFPLVESSVRESMAEVRAAVEEFERLQHSVFDSSRVGLLHGRLTPAQKDAVMAAFGRGELDILVSTSVVEVGIDVPNASVILIENANRFGLAQLHQLRGRVGRGEHQGYCLLLAEHENGNNARLQAMEATTDGFKLAELDWELRGAGDLLGTRQSGGSPRLTQYMEASLVEEAQIEARTLFEEDPRLTLPEHAALRAQLEKRYPVDEIADVS